MIYLIIIFVIFIIFYIFVNYLSHGNNKCKIIDQECYTNIKTLTGDIVENTSSEVGYHMIIVENKSHTKPGVYEISDQLLGNGYAFVNKMKAEIHLNQPSDSYGGKLDSKILKKIKNSGNGIVGYFYKNLDFETKNNK